MVGELGQKTILLDWLTVNTNRGKEESGGLMGKNRGLRQEKKNR